jgi:heme/copper-type cytochrome/quinol oxidase subunit 2
MSQTIPPNAIDWNHFFNLAAIIALVALSVVVAAMVFFTFRYRERKGQVPYKPQKRLKSRARDAMIFAVISIIILFAVTVAGDRMTPNARFQPSVGESYVIRVTAYQWGFDFTPNNATVRGYLNVPANTIVMFNVTSLDVMHNFFLVDFKIRDNKLHTTALWRSHDLYQAWFANAVGLTYLSQYVAGELDVEVGTVTIHSISLHMYEINWKEAKEFLR